MLPNNLKTGVKVIIGKHKVKLVRVKKEIKS